MTDNNDKDSSDNTKQYQDMSRRKFLKNSGYAAGGLVGGGVLVSLLGNPFKTTEMIDHENSNSDQQYNEARMFFTRFEDFVVLEQATERIFPKDDHGPGAIELGVPYFIDKQLAGPWGNNVRDYRAGPLGGPDAETVRSRLTRGKLFIKGVRKMNELSQQRFDSTFDKATEEQQIEILENFQNDEVDLQAVSSASFFQLLRATVLDGAFSDPLYGGNRNMAGWKMKDFPGSIPSYADIIESDKFEKIEPVSLSNYQQKS